MMQFALCPHPLTRMVLTSLCLCEYLVSLW